MKSIFCVAIIFLFFINQSFADEASMKSAMAKKFPYAKLISISKTPYLGLYEVVFDDQLVYTDEKMNYLFSGNVIDMHTMKNLTEEREKQFYAIKFDALPLELAIKRVNGNGKRELAIFTDPNCTYCRNLEKEMVKLDNATVYFFIFPILPGSEEKARSIWCSPDRLKAWEDQMLRRIEPVLGSSCDTTALTKVSKLAKKMKITVTPTMVFEDGTIQPGSLPIEQLDNQLTASSSKK
jgi:thiol:disulfide interchange protein DsbC